jgi:hypothetical protein
LFGDIKKGYCDGITEVYKPYGTNLYYYDVNSLYPYIALKDMPGCLCYYRDFTNISKGPDNVNRESLFTNLFGFFKVKVTAPTNNYLGLLPLRDKVKVLFIPLGTWEGSYFTEELKFAQ